MLTKPIKYHERVMFEVFEKFLKNPRSPTLKDPVLINLDSYVPYQECQTPDPGYTQTEWTNLLRWHVALLMSEFVINGDVAERVGFILPTLTPTSPTKFIPGLCYLNRSGQKLYEELKSTFDTK